MIFDCFMFFNEYELLEVRLHTLAPYVDAFVLCEANRTFQGAPKPYRFDEGVWASPFGVGSKPLYIVHADLSYLDGDTFGVNFEKRAVPGPWQREHAQRRKIVDKLPTISDDDVIILSDVDEIPLLCAPERNFVTSVTLNGTRPVIAWSQDLYYYWVDMRCWEWIGPVSCTWRTLRERFCRDLQALRDFRHQAPVVIPGGWHFSFLGGAAAIKAKIEAFSHAEYRACADLAHIERALTEDWRDNVDLFGRGMMRFEVMPDDSHLPAYLREHKDRFSAWWFDGARAEEKSV